MQVRIPYKTSATKCSLCVCVLPQQHATVLCRQSFRPQQVPANSCIMLSMIDRVADRVARARAATPSCDLCDHESLWPAERMKRQELHRFAFTCFPWSAQMQTNVGDMATECYDKIPSFCVTSGLSDTSVFWDEVFASRASRGAKRGVLAQWLDYKRPAAGALKISSVTQRIAASQVSGGTTVPSRKAARCGFGAFSLHFVARCFRNRPERWA